MPFKKSFLFTFIFTMSSINLHFGYSLAVLSPNIEVLKYQYGWSEDEETTYISVITTMVSVGATIGVFLGGQLIKYGRWRAFIISEIIIIIGTILTLFQDEKLLCIGRFL